MIQPVTNTIHDPFHGFKIDYELSFLFPFYPHADSIGMAIGTFLWGLLAEYIGIPSALQLAAIGLVIGLVIFARYRLKAQEELDLTPWVHWHEPLVAGKLHMEYGPVLVMLEYDIDAEHSREFTKAMRALRSVRMRDGAIRWGLFRDTANPGRFIETFIVESWVEHLRQHERITAADRVVEEHARAFHTGSTPPKVSHFNYAYDMEEMEKS